ncbi:hypothetical protein FIV34_17705 [Luteibacter pinisoli]|uniref:Uncharacterized protein n=1 Tax=Luteibacter pinisoli TaxID=2589080 RepID=A0A4Y5Z7H7_9GAMM|nr:hypothetical protein [Luteibacter pinisoli]QDE40916.1 hypothetical protein FIV34_17705 [Luteibacter pinisoli]
MEAHLLSLAATFSEKSRSFVMVFEARLASQLRIDVYGMAIWRIMMRSEEVARELAGPLYGKEPWPIRFHEHTFSAKRFNTLTCSFLYNNYQFGTQKKDWTGQILERPSGPPPEDRSVLWNSGHIIVAKGGRTFPGPVELDWTSLDNTRLQASVDLDALFKDRLVLHNVSREGVKETWLKTLSIEPVVPTVLVELNDRTVSVYMRAIIATNEERAPGDPDTRLRFEPVLAWTHTY